MKKLGTDNLFIISRRYNLFIKVRENGHIPRSGFLLLDSLNNYNFEGKTVLDVGCGETGILSHYILARKANSVFAVDIDPFAILHAKKSSNLSDRIKWVTGDIRKIFDYKFDVIVSNPPQLPMPQKERKNLKDYHDSCGDTGLELINHLIQRGQEYLNPKGEIFLLVFDFLGVKESYNGSPSIYEIAQKAGFSCEIIKNYPRMIRKGGQTEKNILWIKKVYPKYSFNKNSNGDYCYNMLTIRLRRQ